MRRWLAGALLVVASAVAWAGLLDVFRPINFELTGTVYDAASKRPLEGAFVMASYSYLRGGLGGTATVCRLSRSLVTGKDGRFRFPVEKRDGQSPHDVYSTMPDRYLKGADFPDLQSQKRQDASTYAERNLYLARQDPANPSPQFKWGPSCDQTDFKKPEDGAAYQEYKARVDAEFEKYFPRR